MLLERTETDGAGLSLEPVDRTDADGTGLRGVEILEAVFDRLVTGAEAL